MAIWGVTCLPPQVGHVLVAAAGSAAVSTTSKPFLQLSHMNSYLGMGFLLGPLTSSSDELLHPAKKRHDGVYGYEPVRALTRDAVTWRRKDWVDVLRSIAP
jgi:hypothetical protein